MDILEYGLSSIYWQAQLKACGPGLPVINY